MRPNTFPLNGGNLNGRHVNAIAEARFPVDEIFPTEGACVNTTTIRDFQQSSLAGKMLTEHMGLVAGDLNAFHTNADGYRKYSGVEEVGGGTVPMMDIKVRGESPFEHIRKIRRMMPKTPLMALVRSDAGAGMEETSEDVLRPYIKHSYEAGMDVFRNFHALNDPRAFVRVYKAVREQTKAHFQAAYSWAVFDDPEKKAGDKPHYHTAYNPKAVVKFFEELKALDIYPDSYVIKDPAGVLTPEMARLVTQEMMNAMANGTLAKKPFGIHTHNQAGWAHETYVAAIQAGANFVDCGPGGMENGVPLGGFGGQPPVLPLLQEERVKGKLNFADDAVDLMNKVGATVKDQILTYKANGSPYYDSAVRQESGPDPDVMQHGIAGGQSSMFRTEVKGRLKDMLGTEPALEDIQKAEKEIKAMIPSLRLEAGIPCQVTPVADYLAREASRRWVNRQNADKKAQQGIESDGDYAKGDFYCGFERLLANEMGEPKGERNETMQRRALLQRTRRKAEKFLGKAAAQELEHNGTLRKLAEDMWHISTPVRYRSRLEEVQKQLAQVQAFPTDKGSDFQKQIAADIASLGKAPEGETEVQQKARTARLRQVEGYTPENLQEAQKALISEQATLKEEIAKYEKFAGWTKEGQGSSPVSLIPASSMEEYAKLYDQLQRPAFKKMVQQLSDNPQAGEYKDNALAKVYSALLEKYPSLRNIKPGSDADGLTPEDIRVKLIRSAGFTSACWGELVPDTMHKANAHLLDLYRQGKYVYPTHCPSGDEVSTADLRVQDAVTINMFANLRQAQPGREFDVPEEYFRQRDNLEKSPQPPYTFNSVATFPPESDITSSALSGMLAEKAGYDAKHPAVLPMEDDERGNKRMRVLSLLDGKEDYPLALHAISKVVEAAGGALPPDANVAATALSQYRKSAAQHP